MKTIRHFCGFLLAWASLAWSVEVQGQLRFVTVVPAAANTTFADEDGDFPAYIEIRSLETGILSGHYLTDDPKVPNKWQFPAGYALTSGQTLRLFASGKDRRPAGPNGKLHTNFGYDCSVPYSGLFTIQLAQAHTFSDPTNRCFCNGLQLLQKGAVARTLIPTNNMGMDWVLASFSDKHWIRGVTGVGFDVGENPFRQQVILHHTFDKPDLNATQVLDKSGPLLHHGTMVGGVSQGAGRIEEGFGFSGDAGDQVRVANHVELDPGAGSFTAAIWFRPTREQASTVGQTYTEVMVSKQPAGAATALPSGWRIYRTQASTFVQVVSPAGAKTITLGPTAPNTWHHAALVVNRSAGQVVGYLNGKRIGMAALTSQALDTIVSQADLFEGRDLAGQFPYTGQLDDFIIWGKSLEDSQVEAVFAAGMQGLSVLDEDFNAGPGPGQLYSGLIGTDVRVPMRGKNASAFIRVPFNVPVSPSLATGLKLRMQYSDGFIAYLNGAEVARRNAPENTTWNSKAPIDRPDAEGLVAEDIDLSDYLGVLKSGGNVLAFHGLSHDSNARRFLILPTQLCLEYDRGATGGDCAKRTNGRDFWIAFPENYAQEPDTPLALSLIIAGPPKTVGVVDLPGYSISGFPKSFSIPAEGSLTVAIPSVLELRGPEQIEHKAIRVTASAEVAVYGTTRMDYTTDSFLALPVKCLGLEYWISAYPNVFNGIPILNGTQFAIVAVANNTEVTITPSGKVGSHPAGTPFVVKLKRGETYQLRNENGKPADLTGTRLVANKPISVFGSHRCANVQSVNQFFCDVVVEQLLPVNLWGTSYLVAPLATRLGDTLRILSAEDKNLVTLASSDGNQSFNLDRGQFKDVFIKSATRVNARGPALVTQISSSSDFDHVVHADPFTTLIQPVESWFFDYRIQTPKAVDFEANYVNIVARNLTELNSTTLNGLGLGAWNPADITKGSFVGGGAVYAQVRLQPATAYFIRGKGPIGLTGYGFSEFDSYGYPGGMEFTNFDGPLMSCPPEVTLHCQKPVNSTTGQSPCVASTPDFVSSMDFFDDCTPVNRLKITQSPAPGTPLPIGKHQVVVSASDSSGNSTQCVVVVTVEGPWEEKNFGASTASNLSLKSTVWGPEADPDADGIPNAIEQATGADPKLKTTVLDILKLSIATEGGVQFLKVSYKRPIGGNGIELVLEGRTDAEGADWKSGPDIFQFLGDETIPMGAYEQVFYKAVETVGKLAEQLYFVRLRTGP
ncbi:MAG: HYR domain-containing protein [Verrucomicrobia bacterium]|nr:HYR domain-containing protein [Verrucomicrobiota bacterium]